jgi:hypothetical protein
MLRLRITRVASPLAVHLLYVSIVANDGIQQVSMSSKCLALPHYALAYCGQILPYRLPSWERHPREVDLDHYFSLYYV